MSALGDALVAAVLVIDGRPDFSGPDRWQAQVIRWEAAQIERQTHDIDRGRRIYRRTSHQFTAWLSGHSDRLRAGDLYSPGDGLGGLVGSPAMVNAYAALVCAALREFEALSETFRSPT